MEKNNKEFISFTLVPPGKEERLCYATEISGNSLDIFLLKDNEIKEKVILSKEQKVRMSYILDGLGVKAERIKYLATGSF